MCTLTEVRFGADLRDQSIATVSTTGEMVADSWMGIGLQESFGLHGLEIRRSRRHSGLSLDLPVAPDKFLLQDREFVPLRNSVGSVLKSPQITVTTSAVPGSPKAT